jgi:hypothetical protein
VLRRVEREEAVDASKEYRLLGIRLDGPGPFLRETVMGKQTSATKLYCVAKGDFIHSRLFAYRGAFGVITKRTFDTSPRILSPFEAERKPPSFPRRMASAEHATASLRES